MENSNQTIFQACESSAWGGRFDPIKIFEKGGVIVIKNPLVHWQSASLSQGSAQMFPWFSSRRHCSLGQQSVLSLQWPHSLSLLPRRVSGNSPKLIRWLTLRLKKDSFSINKTDDSSKVKQMTHTLYLTDDSSKVKQMTHYISTDD